MKFSTLTTERLFLRELRLADAAEIFRLRSDPSVNQFVDRPRAVTIDDATDFIHKIIGIIANNEGLFWAITLIGEEKLIGAVVYWNVEPEIDKAEIGYELLPEYQGKGIVSEAVSKVLEFGFEELKFKIITADPKKGNMASISLLERLQFDKIGETEGGYLSYELRR